MVVGGMMGVIVGGGGGGGLSDFRELTCGPGFQHILQMYRDRECPERDYSIYLQKQRVLEILKKEVYIYITN